MPRNVKTLSVSLKYKTTNVRTRRVPFVSRSCFSKDNTGTLRDQAQGLHIVPTQEAKVQVRLVKVNTTTCLIHKRTWTITNTKTNIVKKRLTLKRTSTLHNIKLVLDKKFQFQMLTWIPYTYMRTIDIIVMIYLHIEPAECH